MIHFYRRRSLACLVLAGLLGFGSGQARSQESMVIDGVAAHVNDHVVTIGEVLQIVDRVRPQLMAAYRGAELQGQLRKTYARALNTMIERFLVIDAYEDGEAKLPPWVLDQRVSQHIAERYKGDKSALLDVLQKEAKSYDEWKDDFEDRLIVALMRSTFVDQNIVVSPLEVRTRFEANREAYRTPPKYRVSMIQITPEGDDVAGARKRAEAAHGRISAGESFAVVARETSDDKRAENGGDWGWVEARLVRPVLRDVLTRLAVGDTSALVYADGVFYIMHLTERQAEEEPTFENVQPAIEREIRAKQSDTLYSAWVKRLRDASYIKVFDVQL